MNKWRPDVLLSVLALITAVAALALAGFAWQAPRAPDPRDIATFSGSIDDKPGQLLQFLDDNRHRKV